MSIENLRRDLRAIDVKILDLVRQRLVVCEELARLKQAGGLPLRDFVIEQQLIEHNSARAMEIGIPVAHARKLTTQLIQWCVDHQQKTLNMQNEDQDDD